MILIQPTPLKDGASFCKCAHRRFRLQPRAGVDIDFSNSLIVHQVLKKEIASVTVFTSIFDDFIPLFPRQFQSRSRKYIKHSRQCLTTFPNTSKFVINTRLRVVFSTLVSVFGNEVKHILSCLIYYVINYATKYTTEMKAKFSYRVFDVTNEYMHLEASTALRKVILHH